MLLIPPMDIPAKVQPRRRLVAFTADPASDGEVLPVWANFPSHLTEASVLAALIEVASLDARMEFSEFLKVIAASVPKEWEPSKNVGGRPLVFDWRAEYGKTATSLWTAARSRLLLGIEVRRAAGQKIKPGPTMAAAVRYVLKRARAKARNKVGVPKHLLSPARIKVDAKNLKQAVRVKPARK